jgi:dihydrofolate reductase
MLTFVVAFKNGGGWFMDAFRVQKWYTFNTKDGEAATQWGTMLAMIMSVFASAVALVMVIVILAVLVIRIVMLWIYTILSPFVFLGWAFPPVGKYTEQIWTDFIKQLIIGPVLAFFLWLALAFASGSSATLSQSIGAGTEVCAGVSGLFCTGELQKFVIMLGMMIGGLITAQSVGGAGAKAANWGMGKIKSGQSWASNKANRGFQDVTRISAAKEYMSQRGAAKEGARTDKIQSQVAWMQGKTSAAQKAVIGKPSEFVSRQWGKFGGNEATKIRKEVVDDRSKLKSIQEENGHYFRENIKDKLDTSRVILGRKTYDKTSAGWSDSLTGRTYSNDRMKEILKNVEATKLKKTITRKEATATSHETRQKKADKYLKTGLAVGGGITGIATGGVGLLTGLAWAGMATAAVGAAGGAAAGYGGLDKLKKLKDAGGVDGNALSKYRNEQVTKSQDKMKDDSDGEVLATLDNSSKSPFVRMAALMESMNRHLVDAQQVNQYRNTLQAQGGLLGGAKPGSTGEIRPWNDKKLESRFSAVTDKGKYMAATKDFELAKGTDDAAKSAQDSISNSLANGSISMKDLDIDTLTRSIDVLSANIKTSKFVKEWKENVNPTQQNAIITALERSRLYDAKAKLAFITNIEKAFGSGKAVAGSDKEKFIKSLSVEDINEILTKGKSEQVQALKDAIAGDANVLPDNLKNATSTKATGIKTDLGI